MTSLMHQKETLLLKLLSALVFLSLLFVAFKVIDMSFSSRSTYAQIETAYREQLRLETLLGQLRIEHGTWVSPAEVEDRAKTEIGMRAPIDTKIFALGDAVFSPSDFGAKK